MVRELELLVPSFGGDASHTRCFLHVVNLVAKMLIRQFDTNKRDADKALEDGHGAVEVDEFSDEIEDEVHLDLDQDDAALLSNESDGWVDERDELSGEERKELEDAVRPIKLALVKASRGITHLLF
jgi:hypothetical protein